MGGKHTFCFQELKMLLKKKKVWPGFCLLPLHANSMLFVFPTEAPPHPPTTPPLWKTQWIMNASATTPASTQKKTHHLLYPLNPMTLPVVCTLTDRLWRRVWGGGGGGGGGGMFGGTEISRTIRHEGVLSRTDREKGYGGPPLCA